MLDTSRHSPPGAPLGDAEAEELAQAMSVFSTRSRLKLLFALVGVERTVEELTGVTGLSPTVVSQQLRVLRLLQFVVGRRTGHHVRYRLYDDHVLDLLTAIRHHGEHASSPGRASRGRAGQ